jgi:hypothetical protein
VAEGVATGLAQLVQLKPAAGVQLYVVAPLAVRLTEPPEQTAGADGVTDKVGVGLTLIAILVVSLQPVASVPITVYVVAVLGLAVTTAPVVEFKLLAGLQV